MKKAISYQLLAISFLLLATPTYAADPPPCDNVNCVDISKTYAFGDIATLGQGLNRLIEPAFAIAALGVISYFLIAGFKYISSSGEKEALAEARQMITHSIIGFIMLLMLFLVVEFLFGRLFGVNIEFIKGL